MDWGTRATGWRLGVCLLLISGCWAPTAPGSRQTQLGGPPTADQQASGRVPPLATPANDTDTAAEPLLHLSLSGIDFVRLPAGEFMMGAANWRAYGSAGRFEQPQHRVQISEPFYLATHEVTRGDFQSFVAATDYRTEAERDGQGANGLDRSSGAVVRRPEFVWQHPGFEQTSQHPVVCVSWNDARAYCYWLAEQTGYAIRLPTEAEWEYACRSGGTDLFSTGASPQSLWGNANLADRSLQRVFPAADWAAAWNDGHPFTAPVGLYAPNAFGLYDMHGNVGEWCADWYDGNYYSRSPSKDPTGPRRGAGYHVVRGGSWYNHALACRASNRHDGVPTARSQTNGFRVAFSDRRVTAAD